MSSCPNCKKQLTCGCQKAKASDGTVVCKSCKNSYEKSLTNTNILNTSIQNLQKFTK